MKATQWLAIAGLLLQRHHGLTLADVDFDNRLAAACIKQGTHPFEAINVVAEKYDLERIDSRGFIPLGPLMLKDELAVMDCQLLGEDPAHCPKCGSRSSFEDLPDDPEGRQQHECLNQDCGHTFLCAPEDAAIAA